MESIYRKYHHSIGAYKFIILGCLICILNNLNAQITEEYKGSINNFLTSEFIGLLQKSRDYRTYSDQNVNLKNALNNELNSTTLSINTNAVIEYDKANDGSKEVTITDKMLPFLINYSGKPFNNPGLALECIVKVNTDYHAYYKSHNIISKDTSLRKAIFRRIGSDIELRRISFASELPQACLPKIEEREIELADLPSSVPKQQSINPKTSSQIKPTTSEIRVKRPKPRSRIPRIIIKEVKDNNGQIIIYGFINNHKKNGILIDQETGSKINVSTRDGFFVIKKILNLTSHKALNFKYQYGQKFITDRKLIFVKS